MTAPDGLGPRGTRLWNSIEGAAPQVIELADARRDIAIEASRAADQLDILSAILDREGLVVYDDNGRATKPHPALSELNRLRPLVARLIVALQLPDPATGARGRAMHGVQKPTRPGASALERVSRAKPAA